MNVQPLGHSATRLGDSWLRSPLLLLALSVMVGTMTTTALFGATCDGSDPGNWPCCTASSSSTGNTYNSSGGGGGQATAAVNSITATAVWNGSYLDLECAINFDYTTTCAEPRTLRFCWYACPGNNATPTCSTPSCIRFCEEVDFSSGNGQSESHRFHQPAAPFDMCWYCRVAVVDVEGNESCYPPSTYCATIDTCSQGCGPGVMSGISTCADL